ncbi:putative phosphohydrolase [Beggiatoa alba B18LD]|uniref:Putative phosphohydrolase n=1 Tax=Beggiatoa alba B18LD TaxID=395493 RepID=I3CJH0_9GAMM|nr:phosphodiesterase YaeI [Beggiatoa alba]EIJ43763.1 putative phosphohydrolase [Beggiatoa alba B18LD]
MLSRRQFLRMGFYSTLVGGVSYSYFIESQWLKITEQLIPLEIPLKKPITLLHLSDFHASQVVSLDFIETACQLATQIEADCICLTGDYVSSTLETQTLERYRQILHRLSTHAPTFACLGNHDGGEWAIEHHGYANTSIIRELLQSANIQLLHNQHALLNLAQQPLKLVGLGDVWAGEADPQTAFAQLPTVSAPTILLSHNPDTKDFLMDYSWDLMLSGHTHGGQFVIPFLNRAPFAPVLDKSYVAGLYLLGKKQLYVTTGVGNLYGLRFNCRPEISVLRLT